MHQRPSAKASPEAFGALVRPEIATKRSIVVSSLFAPEVLNAPICLTSAYHDGTRSRDCPQGEVVLYPGMTLRNPPIGDVIELRLRKPPAP